MGSLQLAMAPLRSAENRRALKAAAPAVSVWRIAPFLSRALRAWNEHPSYTPARSPGRPPMNEAARPQSLTDARYVDPSAETILQPGLKIGDLLQRNMTQPYVLRGTTATGEK
jgi:hypothetical protein